MSLLQPPRRSSSDLLDLGSVDLGRADASGSAMVLDRELDFSAERPAVGATSKRGPGVLVAAIVASSLTLAGIILLVRGDASEAAVSGPAALPPITDGSTAPAVSPVEPPSAIEPAATRPVPVVPSRVASQAVPPVARDSARKPVEITPTAIAPSRAAIRPPLAVGEVAPSAVDLPAPVFDEATPEATPEATAPTIEDDVPEPLPGIEEPEPTELEVDEPTSATAPLHLEPVPTDHSVG